MKLLRLSVLLAVPVVFCATLPEAKADDAANAITNQFLDEQSLEILLKEARRVTNEAVAQRAQELQIKDEAKDISELMNTILSDPQFKAAQVSLPLGGLLGSILGTLNNITVTTTGPLADLVNVIAPTPVSDLTSLLNATLSNPLNTTGGVLANPLNLTSTLPVPLNLTSTLPVPLNLTSTLPIPLNLTSALPIPPVETALSSPLNLTDLLNNGIFNLSNPLGLIDPLTNLTSGLPIDLGNLTNVVSNLTGILPTDLTNLTNALANLTQNPLGNLPLLNGTFDPLPFVLGGILNNIAQGVSNGILNPLGIPSIGPIASILLNNLSNLPPLLAIILTNANNEILQNIFNIIALGSDGLLPQLLILVLTAVRTVLNLVFGILGGLGQDNPLALPPILLGVVGQLLSNGLLRIGADPFNNVDHVEGIVREVLQRAIISDPIVLSAMSEPNQENIANAISTVMQSVAQRMAVAN